MNTGRFMLCRRLILLVVAVSLMMIMPGISAAATISGTVTNISGKTGRVYLSVQWQGGGDTGFGVSITSAGAFTIRGIQQNGDYIVKAFQDTQGSGSQHANDPTGSAMFSVAGTDVSSVGITLDNPTTVGLQPPEGVDVVSGDKGALIMWQPATDGNGKEIATSYKVYWSTGQNPGPANTTGGGSSPDLPSNDKKVYMTALNNGTLYFAVTAKLNGGTDSAPTNANNGAPVTIGAPTGGVTVSGTISSSATLSASTPLWIALASINGPPIYIAPKITTPSNSQTYTITGVMPGAYQVIAILDMNNNGVIDLGDIDNTESNGQTITVGDTDLTNANVTLVPTDAQVRVTTNHYKQDIYEGYSLNFEARAGRERPVNIAVSGPQLSGPIDMGLNSWGGFGVWPGVAAKPTLLPSPDIYSFAIVYSRSGTSPLTAPITGVLDSFATPTSPVGYISYPFTPTDFDWSAPLTPPTPYTYSFWLNNVPNFNSDNYSNLPSSSTSVNFPGEFVNGTRYDWSIAVVDSFGNTAQSQTNFTATSSPAIISFTPTSAIVGATVTLNGINFDATPVNNTVTFGGTTATVTAASTTQLTVTVPVGATTGQISVHNSNGSGSSNTMFTVTLPADTEPPTVPTGVTATAVGPNQININWNSSTDNVGVINYIVYRDGFQAGTPSGPTNNFWPDTFVSLGTTYTYTVAACDGSDNCSAPSSSAQATTPIAPFSINTAGYADLPTALSNVPVDGEIKAQAGLVTLTPPLTLTKGVTISGGYDSNYTGISGYTTIPGRVNIRGTNSKVIFKNIRVK